MNKLYTPTEADIRTWVGDQSFSRSRSYTRDGSLLNLRRQGNTLKAQCLGSAPQPYRVEVTLGQKVISAGHCSCPVGDGGRCKHAAALLLAWRNDPDSFTAIEEVTATLNKFSKEELIALVTRMIDRHPDLESLLELSVLGAAKSTQKVDPKVFERQVKNVFKGLGDYDEYGAAGDAAQQLAEIKQLGDTYAGAGDWRNAVMVYKTVAEGALDNYEMLDDEGGEVGDVVNECVTGLGDALPAVEDGALREVILRALFDIYRWDLNYGGIDMGYEATDLLIANTTPAEKQMVAGWVRELMPKGDDWSANYRRQALGGFLLHLEADTLDDETFLRISRETGRTYDLVDRLLSLHRIEEAIAAAQQAGDYDLLNMEKIFAGYEQAALFDRLMTERARTSQDSRILEWLKRQAVERNDPERARQLAETVFWQIPSLAGYQELKQLAAGNWPALRSQLITRLTNEKRYHTLLTQIYLDEGDIDQALRMVQPGDQRGLGFGYGFGGPLELEVAKAAEAKRPRAAIDIYLKMANQAINARNRSSYAIAAGHLLHVRRLYQTLSEEASWRRVIDKIRTDHRNLRALQDELDKAKL